MAEAVANGEVHAYWDSSVILSGACHSCQCMPTCSCSVRSGCGFLVALLCLCREGETHGEKKLQSNMFTFAREHSSGLSWRSVNICVWNLSPTKKDQNRNMVFMPVSLTADCLLKLFVAARQHRHQEIVQTYNYVFH